jgi:hypothetical protein
MSLFARCFHSLLAVLLISSLAACGGGGDGDVSADTVKVDARISPYVGRWVACSGTSSNNSEKDEFLVTAIGGSKTAVTRTLTRHAGSGTCASSPTPILEEKSVMTLLGATVTVVDPAIGSVTLEKLSQAGDRLTYSGNPPSPTTSPFSGTVFAGVVDGSPAVIRIGDADPLNAQSTPTALLPQVYVKQP